MYKGPEVQENTMRYTVKYICLNCLGILPIRMDGEYNGFGPKRWCGGITYYLPENLTSCHHPDDLWSQKIGFYKPRKMIAVHVSCFVKATCWCLALMAPFQVSFLHTQDLRVFHPYSHFPALLHSKHIYSHCSKVYKPFLRSLKFQMK